FVLTNSYTKFIILWYVYCVAALNAIVERIVLLMAIIGTTFAQSNTYLPPKQNGYDYPAPPGRPVRCYYKYIFILS
uniref:Innexin n=1 Tax=Megaselia scalaris TaxID=36166 RepID=T1GK90_MEGSC